MRGLQRDGRSLRPRRRRRRTVVPAVLRAAVLAASVVALVDVARTPPDGPDPLGVRDGERLLIVGYRRSGDLPYAIRDMRAGVARAVFVEFDGR